MRSGIIDQRRSTMSESTNWWSQRSSWGSELRCKPVMGEVD